MTASAAKKPPGRGWKPSAAARGVAGSTAPMVTTPSAARVRGRLGWILRTYYVAGGKAPNAAYRSVLRFTLQPARALQELTVAANFVEVFLAKEGHDGPVGINYLRKIELPIPCACYGAMLAGSGAPSGHNHRGQRANLGGQPGGQLLRGLGRRWRWGFEERHP